MFLALNRQNHLGGLLFLVREGAGMHDQAEEHLRAGLVAGRAEAFAVLYDRHGRSLHRVAWTLLRSRQDAEDAVPEGFLRLFRSRSAFAQAQSLRAYLFSAL